VRADAQANRDRLLVVAGEVIAEHGVDVSMRDIARRAGVGLATLLRHFPTREALLEALLRTRFDELTARAAELEGSASPRDALVLWLHDFLGLTSSTRGAVSAMVRAIDDPDSALHASCVNMRGAGSRLLSTAQAAGVAPDGVDGADLYALASALAWLGDQPGQQARAARLFDLVIDSILTEPAR
jgi:AcrR family transcriptional regulator